MLSGITIENSVADIPSGITKFVITIHGKMKKLFLLLLTLTLLPGHSYPSGKIKRLQEKLDAICKELVPDKRVDICRVKVSKGKNGKLEVWGEVTAPEYKNKILAAASGNKITDKISLLPDTSLVKKPWGLVTVSVANLKSEPSHASEMATQAILGTPVKILKKEGSWLYVQTPDHYLAWVTGASIKELNQSELQHWNKGERLIYLENYGLVFSDLQRNEIISDLVAGSILRKSEKPVICCRSGYPMAVPELRKGKALFRSVNGKNRRRLPRNR